MATKPRRDSIISHRQRPSLASITSLSPPMATSPLPPPAMAPLHPFVLPSDSKQLFHLAALPAAFTSATRRFRLRPSILGLMALLALTSFALLHQHLNDTPSLSFQSSPPPAYRYTNPSGERGWQRQPLTRPSRPPKIALAPEQELAAVVAFMAALPSNALPDSVDPLLPIDPDLVLDFDTRTSKAVNEVRSLVEDTWARHPVVLLSRRYSPVAREIKIFLDEYNLKPAPMVFDVDERADAPVLTPLLHRLTGAVDLPILLIAGRPIGTIDAIRELHKSGQLRTMVAASGAVIDGAKKKKKGRRAAVAALS